MTLSNVFLYRFIYRFVVSFIHSKLRINTCVYERTRNDCVNNIHFSHCNHNFHIYLYTHRSIFMLLLFDIYVHDMCYSCNAIYVIQLVYTNRYSTYMSSVYNWAIYWLCALCFHLITQCTNMDKTSTYPTYSLFCTTFTYYVSFRT
jgi:hypothetical protein